MPATKLTFGLTLDGSVDDFDATATEALATALKSTLGCIEPLCLVALTISASSVAVSVEMTIPDTDHDASDQLVADVERSSTDLSAMAPASISSTLASGGASVSVLSSSPLQKVTGVSIALAVAPPPPSPPPSGDAQGGENNAPPIVRIIVVVVIAIVIIGVVIAIVFSVRYMMKKRATPPKDAGVTITQTSSAVHYAAEAHDKI